MKVIRRGKMEDGTDIQIEDWSKDYRFYEYGTHLIAYPKNRFGETQPQLIYERNMSFNTLKEIGYVEIQYDGFKR